jgi:hypothetical protein
MFKKIKPKKLDWNNILDQFPHCDPRILHAPGECEYCDNHQEWQALRQAWGIAFTNYEPEGSELPCPANAARGDGCNSWYGNKATSSHNHVVGGNRSDCQACQTEINQGYFG